MPKLLFQLLIPSAFLCMSGGCKGSSSAAKKPAKKVDGSELPSSKSATEDAAPVPEGVYTEIGAQQGKSCQLAMCFAGPGTLMDPSNVSLGDMCRRLPGVVRRCEGEQCRSLWSEESWSEGMEALISAMDVNADGKVDDADPRCTIAAAGWSTGAGAAAVEFPAALLADDRVSADRAVVDHLVVVAPRMPEGAALALAPNVAKAFIYRHTATPEGDCSKDFEGGPWLSPPPECGPDTTCIDYDYSLEPALAYLSRRGARGGGEVGHCNIMDIVSKVVALDNLVDGQEAYLEHVPRLADGTPGGRARPEGPKGPDAPETP